MRQLMSIYQRRPRVVMKATLQLDPAWTSWATGCRTCSSSTHQNDESIFTSDIKRMEQRAV